TLTLADFGIGSAMILAERAHYPVEPYGEIKRWYATLRALPAWQTTLAQSAPPAQAAARRGRVRRSKRAEPRMDLCEVESARPADSVSSLPPCGGGMGRG